MRKIFKNMAWMLTATLAMAACSDSLDESDNTGQGPLTGEGYVKVAINMPSVSSTRAFNESTDLNDGDANEYAVKSGIIAFFEGTTEANATFVKAYNLDNLSNSDYTDSPNQITSKIEAQIIEAPMLKESSNQMYALVILNPGDAVSVSGGNLILENGTSDIELTSTSTIAALNAVTVKWGLDVSNITNTNKGFLMLNSPLYNASEPSKTQTLVPVTIYSTEVEAGQNEAAQIYVERIVAKVDVMVSGNANSLTVTKEGIYKDDVVTFMEDPNDDQLGWTLNVTNKNTVPLRNIDDVTTWATGEGYVSDFIGTNNIDSKWSRIYWAKDVNYDDTSSEDDFTIYDKNSSITWKGYSNNNVVPLYCLENTAPYQYNNENNTTSVLIKAKYDFDPTDGTNGASFFIMDKNGTTLNETDFLKKIKEIITGVSSATNLSINTEASGGYYKTAEDLNSLIDGKDSYSFTEDDVVKIGEIRYYKDGGCYYYAIPIEHFGQEYKAGDDKNQSKYQGRYGVVRNNWYQITINSVSGPGEPEVTPPDDEHVDDEEGYIKCTINVLSWAKRSQSVDL